MPDPINLAEARAEADAVLHSRLSSYLDAANRMASLVLALALELEEARNHESALFVYASGVSAELHDRFLGGIARVLYEGSPDLLRSFREEIRKGQERAVPNPERVG